MYVCVCRYLQCTLQTIGMLMFFSNRTSLKTIYLLVTKSNQNDISHHYHILLTKIPTTIFLFQLLMLMGQTQYTKSSILPTIGSSHHLARISHSYGIPQTYGSPINGIVWKYSLHQVLWSSMGTQKDVQIKSFHPGGFHTTKKECNHHHFTLFHGKAYPFL